MQAGKMALHVPSRFLVVWLVGLVLTFPAGAFQTSSKNAIIVDASTGVVLFERDADTPVPPASMSKLMTLNVVFEALKSGQLRLDEKLRVSRYAMNHYGGSTMFLDTTDHPTVEELIRGVVVLSGNDASVVLAETLSPDGTEQGFSRLMNERAEELGMANSNFTNSNGWPDPSHMMSVRDLYILTNRLITEFPTYYRYFAEKEFPFDGRAPSNRFNRNPLLKENVLGADGLKTGYTRESGYGLVGSAILDGNRVIFVLSGLESAQIRAQEGQAVINWYNRQFKKDTLFHANEKVTVAPVWMGSVDEFEVGVAEDLKVIYPVNSNADIKVRATIDEYPQAPIRKGQEIGRLQVDIPELEVSFTSPLIALTDVDEADILKRLLTTALTLMRQAVPAL